MANGAKRFATSPWAVVGLIASLVFAVWWRGHTFGPTVRDLLGVAPWPVVRGESEPLDCDEAAYGYMARRMLEGDRLYADLSENKPPLGYWIYQASVAIGGANELTIRLLPVPFVLATVSLIWWLGLRLGGPFQAVLAAFLTVFLSTDPYLYGNGAQLEQAINCFAVSALSAVVQASRVGARRGTWLLLAGVAVGMAAAVKQVALVHVFALGAAVLAMPKPIAHPSVEGSARWRSLGSFLMGVALVLAAIWGLLMAQGVGAEAYDDIVRHGRALASDVDSEPNAPSRLVRWLTGNADPSGVLPPPFGSTDYLVWWGEGSWPIWLVSLPSLVWLAFVRPSFERRVLVVWTASAFVQVLAPGLYWAHYYLLPVPGLALAIAVTLGDLTTVRKHAWWAWMLGLALIGGITGFGIIQVKDYLLVPAEELTIRYKGGQQWVQLRKLGRMLGEETSDWGGAKLHIWGWQSPLLFYSGLDASSRHFFTNNLMRDYADRPHSVVTPRIAELMGDIRSERPELVLVAYPPFPSLRQFLGEFYLPSSLLPFSTDGRGLWIRKDRWADLQFETGRLSRSVPQPDQRSRRLPTSIAPVGPP